MFDATAERRFLLLKKKLDSLHYCQPLTIDSSVLVERLLSDLIRTTEGFQSLKKSNEDLKQEALQKTSGLLPLQKENGRLLKENNELHYELIKVKETCEFQENRWKSSLKTLEGEKNDLKFLISQKQGGLSRLEEENQALKQKLDVILSKAYTTKLKGLKDKDFELENLKNSINTNYLSNKKFGENKELDAWNEKRVEDLKVWAEKLREADEKMLMMENTMKSLNLEKTVYDEKIRYLEQGTMNRDKEIQRLQSKLELTLPCDNMEKMAFNFENKQFNEKIMRLEHQIDFLTKENQGLGQENKNMKRDYARTELIKQELLGKTQENEDLLREIKGNEEKYKGKIEDIEKEMEKAKLEAEILHERVYSLELQNQDLMKKCEKIKEVYEAEKQEKAGYLENNRVYNELASAYNSDKRVFVEKIETLASENKALQSRISDKSLDNERFTKEIAELNKQIAMGKSETLSYKRENEQLNFELEEKTRNYEVLAENLKALQQELAIKEKDFNDLEANFQENKTLLARFEARTKHFETENNRIKTDFQRIQATKDSTDSAKQKLESLYESSLREVEYLKGEARFFEEKENSYLRDIFTEKEASNSMKLEINGLREKVKGLETENMRIMGKNEGLLGNVRNLEAKRLEQEKDLLNMKILMENQGSFERKIQVFIEENEGLSKEINELKRNLDQKILENIEFGSFNQQKEKVINDLRVEIERFNEKNMALKEENTGISQNLRRIIEKNHDLENLKVLIESFKEKLAMTSEENSRLMHELTSLQAKNEQNSNEKSRLLNKSNELQLEIEGLNAQIREFKTNELNTSSLGNRMVEKTRGYELLIEDLKSSNKQLAQKNEGLMREVDDLLGKIRTFETRNQELEDSNSQLNILINGLERNKEELFDRLRNTHQEKSRDNEEFDRILEEKRGLLNEKSRLENEIKSLKSNILQIDQERDEMQGILDHKTEENVDLINRIKALEVGNLTMKRENQGEMKQKEAFNRTIGDLEAQLKENKRKIAGFSEENEDLKRRIAIKQQENSEMAEDLRLLSREHAKMNEEMTILVNDRDFLTQELKRITFSGNESLQIIRGLEIERDDLLGLYKESAGENEGLKRNLDDVIEDNKEMFEKMKSLERETRMFEEERANFQRKEANIQGEIRTLQRNLANLTGKSEKAESLIQKIEMENRGLQAELSSFQDNLSGENFEKLAIKKEFIQLENEKSQCLALNEKLELELTNKAGYLHDIQRDMRDLEEVLEKERKARFEIDCENQNLREENAKLRMGSFRKEDASSRNTGRESWKRSLNEVAIGTEGLKEKARSLQKDYEEILRKEG